MEGSKTNTRVVKTVSQSEQEEHKLPSSSTHPMRLLAVSREGAVFYRLVGDSGSDGG